MKKLLFIAAICCISLSCKSAKTGEPANLENNEVATTYKSFGEKITDADVLTKAEVIEKYKNLKPGDTVNMKFASEVKEVCQKKGCWMKMDMGDQDGMVRFKDYGFFMPKDIAGKDVIVADKAYVEEMSIEDQQHYAEDAGKSTDEIAAITTSKRTLAFEANGVLIPEMEKE